MTQKSFLRLVNRFESAVRLHAYKGYYSTEVWEELEINYQQAKMKLYLAIKQELEPDNVSIAD